MAKKPHTKPGIPRKKTWIFWVLGALLVLAGASFGLWQGFKPEPIAAYTVQAEDIVATLTLTGEVRPRHIVTVSVPVSARILSIAVDRGDSIRQGQLLVQLDTRETGPRFVESEERARQAQAIMDRVQLQNQTGLASTAAAYQEAEQYRKRLESLYKQGAVSAQEYDAAEMKAKMARQDWVRQHGTPSVTGSSAAPEIREAQAGVQAARAALSATAKTLGDYRVLSPLQGIVLQRLQDPGDLANPGQAILKIADPKTLEVIGFLEESDLDEVRLGNRALVTLDAHPDTPLSGRVTEIGSEVNPDKGTVEITVKLNALPPGITPLTGMTADINLETHRLKNALVIPATAVREEKGETVVYRFKGNRLKLQPVKVRRVSTELYQVLSGLEDKETIAIVADPSLLNKRRIQAKTP